MISATKSRHVKEIMPIMGPLPFFSMRRSRIFCGFAGLTDSSNTSPTVPGLLLEIVRRDRNWQDEAARKTGGGRTNSVFQTFRYAREQLPWLATP